MPSPKPRSCKGCGSTTRELPHPGPRCATCHKAFKKEQKAKAHNRHVQDTYGVSETFYARMKAAQDGYCAICRRANGKTKRLAVDHNHGTGEPRGLLCSNCNRMLGHARDDPEFFRRAARYLASPPAAPLLIASN